MQLRKMYRSCQSYVWWSNIDKDIESYVSRCLCCQQMQPIKKEIITNSWPKTLYPQRIHIDFFTFAAKEILILSDAHTKYCDVFIMCSTNLQKVPEKLINFFCNFGLATEIVSDNGPPFQSKGF